jgi:hypothetical protein
MNSRIYLAFLLVAFLFLAGCSQEDLLRSSMKVGCCNLNESKKGNCVLEGNDAGVSVLKTYSCDLASAGTCSAQIQYTFNILDEASKKITTITPKPEDKTIPICKVDTMDNPCIQRQCVAQVCGPFDFVPESILSYRDNIVLSQKMADGESDDEDAPSSDKSKSIKLYGTKCMNLNMDENLSRVFTNTKGSMVNIFRLGVGSSFQDFEKYRLLFPFSDLACNVYPFLSAKERYTNYFRMDYESAYANLAATFNNLTYCPTQQGKSPLRNDIYGDVKQPPNYKFENVTAIADGKVRFSFEKFDDNFYDQLLRWTDRSVLNQVTPANYPAPIQTEFECAAPSDCRSGNCDQNVYRRGMCQRDDGRWVNCECYGGGMYCAGETVIYPEPLGVKTTQDAVSKYDKGIPLYIRIQRQVAMKKIYDNPGGFLKRSYTNVYQCYFKGDGFGVDYKCFFAEDEKDKYPYADYFNCTDISDGKFDCNYLGGEYNNGARFLFYDVGTLPGLNDDDFYSPFSNKKLLSPKQNKEITCKSEADCPIGNNCNFALGKCVPAGMCADIKNIGNLGGSCKADADCPFYQKCGDSGKCEFSYCNSDAECPSNYCLNYQCSGQLNYYSPFSTSSAACSAPYSCSVQTTDANGVGIGYCRFNGDPAAVSCGNNNPFCPLGYSCDSVHQKCILDTNPQCFNAYECQTSVSIDSATYLLDCDQEEDSDGLKIPGKYLCGGATIAMDNFEPIPDAINFLQNPPNGIYFFGKSREVTEVSDDQPGSDFRIGGDEDKPPSFIGYTFLTESEFKQTNFFKTCELADKDYSVFYFEFAPLYSMSSGGGSGQILNVFMLGSFDYGIIGSTYPYTYAGTETGYYYAGDLGKSVRPFDKLVNNRGYGSYGDNSFYPMEIIFIKSLGRCKSNDNTPTPVVRSLGWCDACSYLTVAQQKVESSSSYSTLTNEYRRSSDPNQEPYKTVDICEDTGDESTCTIKHKDGVSTIKLLDYMDKKPESVYLLTSEVNDLKEGVMPILDVSDDSNWKPLKNSAISDAISQLNSRISDINDWIDILNRAKEDTLGMQPTTVHRVTKYVDPITKTEQTVDTPVSFNRDTINTQLDLILGHLYNAKNNLTSAVKDLQNAQSVSGDYQKRSTVTGALPKMQKASDELVEARKITGPCELASDSSLLDPISNIQKTYLNSLVDQITHSTNGIDDAINNLQKAIDLVKTPKTGSDPKTFASLAAQYADIVQKETYKASLNMRKLEVPTAIPDLMYSGYYKIYYSIPFMTASTPDYNMAMAKLTMGKTEAEESIDQFNAAYKTVSISNHLPDYCNSMYMVDNNNLLSGQQSELENKLSKTTFKLSWELTRLMDAIETNGPVLLLVNKINLKEVDKDLADEIKTRALIARSICGKCMVGIQIDNGPEFGTDGKLTGSGRKDLYFKTLFALNQSGGDDLFNTFDGVTFKFFPNEYVKEDSSICGSDDGIYNKTLSEIQSYGFETLKYRKFSIINEFSINSSKYPSCWATQINDDEKQSPLFKLFSRLTLHQRSLTEAGVVGLIYTGTTDLTTKTQNGALTYSEQFCSLEQAARYYVSAPAITIYQKVPFVKEAECIKCNIGFSKWRLHTCLWEWC